MGAIAGAEFGEGGGVDGGLTRGLPFHLIGPMGGYMYLMTNLTRHPIYCGMTSDLGRRIYEHRERLIPDAYTGRYRMTRLVYYEVHDEIINAIQREKNVKHYSWRWKADMIETMNPEWRDLWHEVAQSPF